MNRPSPRLRTALEFLLYAILTAIMLHATWLTWPDAYLDFSREHYRPWRVSCGDVLYRDLAYDFGPVSVYVNAALFAILGRPSIHALFVLNFVFWTATLLEEIKKHDTAQKYVESYHVKFPHDRK